MGKKKMQVRIDKYIYQILRSGKFVVGVSLNDGKMTKAHVGTFGTIEEAIEARDAFLKKHNIKPKCKRLYTEETQPRNYPKKRRAPSKKKKKLETQLPPLPQQTTLQFQIGGGRTVVTPESTTTTAPTTTKDEAPKVYRVPVYGKVPERLLLLSDLHFPYHHRDALRFISQVLKEVDPDLVVILGDEVDSHSLSFYPQHPSLSNATDELKSARKMIGILNNLIGERPVLAVDSNHTSRVYRKGRSAGIPKEMILPYEQLLGVDWKWAKDWVIPMPNGTHLLCSHQKGNNARVSGQAAGMNLAMGHYHKRCAIECWTDNRNREMFSLQVPCTIDFDSPAYAYDENSVNRPNLGCAIVVKGEPQLVRMYVDEDNRWTGELWSNCKRK